MDVLTNLIKSEIKRQYKSVRNFSDFSKIPYSTLSNALNKGVGLTSYETISSCMVMLGISPITNKNMVSYYNNKFYDINKKLSTLDEKGLHTVLTVLNLEYERCIPPKEE